MTSVCPRCGGIDVRRESEVLNDDKYDKVILKRTVCGACTFAVVNVVWLDPFQREGDQMQYVGWMEGEEEIPAIVPEVVKRRLGGR